MSALTETNAIPNRRYLEELTIRMDTLGRYIESQGNREGFLGDYRDEALSIAREMVQRAQALCDTLAARKLNKTVSLEQLRQSLSGMSLVSVVRDYDRAMTDLQNFVGDQVHDREVANEAADVAGRDSLDALESEHLRLHRIMREICGAASV